MLRNNNEYSDDMTDDSSFDNEEENDAVDISKIEIFLNYVREIIASNDEIIYNYIISWIAYLIQNPREKMRIDLVLIGNQGVCKTIFTDIIVKLYEEYANNDRFKNKVLIVINDLNDRSTTIENLKNKFDNCVGEKIATIDAKYIRPNPMDNISAFIFTTADKRPFWIDGEWKRDLVVEVSDRMRNNTDYFNNLSNSLTNEFYKNLFNYFRTYNINDFNPRVAPDTEIKTHIMKCNGYNYIYYMNENRDKFYPKGIFTSISAAYKSYSEFCERKGALHTFGKGTFGKILKEWCDFKSQYDPNTNTSCKFYVLKDEYVDTRNL